jgi:secreted trypsin-like serine protease
LKNDIALLFLKEQVILAPHINTACLPYQDMEFNYQRCYASGWGRDKFGKEGQYQVILKNIELPVVEFNECQDRLRTTRLTKFFKLHRSFMCAGGEIGKDVCVGDGGGPLYCESEDSGIYYQAGIIAWGIGCGSNIPGVYTNVAKFREWIDQKVSQRGYDTQSYQHVSF